MIVLDTHAWLWWLSEPSRLGEEASALIEEARQVGSKDNRRGIAVSAISVWETAMLVKKNRLEMRMGVDELVRECLTLPFMTLVPITHPVALRAVALEPLHADPADRFIVATAMELDAPLITKDERIMASKLVKAVW